MKYCITKKVRRIFLSGIFLISFVYLYNQSISSIFAATFSVYTVSESNTVSQESSTDTVTFDIATAGTLEEIDINFYTTSGGVVTPAHVDASGATLGTLTGLNGSWAISSASTGAVKLQNATGQVFSIGDHIVIPVQNIINPKVGDCSGASSYYDTCYVKTVTYSDLGTTSVDNGVTSIPIQLDPSLSFSIQGVGAGTLTNGVTTTGASTPTTLPFGDVVVGNVSYLAQQLSVTTNATNGYSVYMKVATQMQGLYSLKNISPFAATGTSWANPVAWSSPTGNSPGVNTAWIGANTSDTRVSGWSSASAKFAPADGNSNKVMYSSGPDTGTNVYVTYGMEANVWQPADAYSGTIVYTIVANY